MYIFDVSFIEALSLRQCTCLVHNALGSPQWFLGLMYECHYFAGLHVRKLCHMHKSCRATLSWIWMPQKRPQTTSPWKVLQHLIAEFPTNKLQNQSHQLCWMHESTIYIYIYLQMSTVLCTCFELFRLFSRRATSCWLVEEAMVLCCISPVSWSHFEECPARLFHWRIRFSWGLTVSQVFANR